MPKSKRYLKKLDGNQRFLDEYIEKSKKEKEERLEEMRKELREFIGVE
jgi:hypothetical protein